MKSLVHAVVMAMLLTACSGSGKDKAGDAAGPTALVRTAVVQAGAPLEVVRAYGAIESSLQGQGTVTAPVESIVTAVLVAVGDPVHAGQPVLRVRPSPQATLDLAKARQEAKVSEAAAARAVRLRASGLVSDADVETAAAAAATARTTAQSLQSRAGGVLLAPSAGVVQTIPLAPGALAAAGTPLLTLGSALGARVRLGLDPVDASRVRPGDSIRLTSLTGGRQASSSVVSVDPRADPQTRQASAYARAPDAAAFALGEPIEGEISIARHSGAAVVPKAALLYEGDKPYVFVIVGGVAHRRDVALGIETPDQVEVRQGLAIGERVVVEGVTALEDGLAVREEKGGGP